MPTERRANDRTLRWLDAAGMTVVVVLAAALLWRHRDWIDTDTVTHADMSDAVLRGGWREVINGYFSPAWALLIAAARGVFGTDASREAPIIRGMQWCLSFVAVWQARRLLSALRQLAADMPDEPLFSVGTLAGTALFWTGAALAIDRLSLNMANPDLLLTCLALGAATSLLSIRRAPALRAALALGAWIGVMYWTKGIAVPIGAGFVLAAGVLAAREVRVRVVVRVVLVAVAIAAPLAAALSVQQQRLDVGDTGRLTMLWFTAGMSSVSPNPDAKGTEPIANPWTRLTRDLPVYAYEGGPPGTYPPWRDPVHWQEGLRVRPSVAQFMQRVRSEGAEFWNFYFGATLASLALAAAVVGGMRTRLPRVTVALALPPALTVASYLPVLFEPRYFAPVVLLALASAMTLSPAGGRRWPWMMLAVGASVGWSFPTALETLSVVPVVLVLVWLARGADAYRLVAIAAFSTALTAATIPGILVELPVIGRSVAGGTPDYQNTLAHELNGAGVAPGMRVAMVGIVGPGHYDIWWARRARLAVAAEVPRGFEDSFWRASVPAQQSALSAMSRAGAAFVVARRPANDLGMDPAWIRLGETGYAVRPLKRDVK